MYKLALIFSVFVAINATAKNDSNFNCLYTNSINSEKHELEKMLFANLENSYYPELDVNEIKVIEINEEVELGFDVTNYLPKYFNAIKGKHELDWSSIKLVEVEEEAEIGFDTQAYLPLNFDPYAEVMVDKTSICFY